MGHFNHHRIVAVMFQISKHSFGCQPRVNGTARELDFGEAQAISHPMIYIFCERLVLSACDNQRVIFLFLFPPAAGPPREPLARD